MAKFSDYVRQQKLAGLSGNAAPTPRAEPKTFSAAVRQRKEQLLSGGRPAYGPDSEFSEQRSIQSQAARIQADLTRLGQNRPEAVENWGQIADTVIKLRSMDNDDARQYASAVMAQYEQQLRPHVEVTAGEEWWEQNYEKPKGPGGWRGVVSDVLGNSVVSNILEVLDKPSQGVLHAVSGIRSAIDQNDGIGVGDALKHAGSSFARGVTFSDDFNDRKLTTPEGLISFDKDDDGVINFREALGYDPEAGGIAAGVFDLAGVIMLDPLTYASFGTAGLAKGALRGIATQAGRNKADALGKLIVKTIQTKGWKALDDETRDVAVQWIRKSARESTEAYLRTADNPGLLAAARRSLRRVDDDVAKQIDKRAARMQRAVERGGRRGVKFAGQTVIPYRALFLEEIGLLPHHFRRVADGASTGVEALEDILEVAPDHLREAALAAAIRPQTGLRALNAGPQPEALRALTAGGEAALPATQPDLYEYLTAAFKGREAENRLVVQIDVLRDIIESPDIMARLGLTADDVRPVVDALEERVVQLLPPSSRTPNLPFGEARREAAERYARTRPARFGAQTRKAREAEPTPLTREAGGTPSSREVEVWTEPEILGVMERIAALRARLDDMPANVGPASRIPPAAPLRELPASTTFGVNPGFRPNVARVNQIMGIRGTGPGSEVIEAGMSKEAAAEARRIETAGRSAQASLGTTGSEVIEAGPVPRNVDEAVAFLEPDNVLRRLNEAAKEWEYVPGLIDRVYDNRLVRWVQDHFVPRAQVTRTLGREVSEMLDDASVEALGKFNQSMNDILRRLDSKLVRRAEREAGGREPLNRMLNEALDNPTDLARVADEAAAAGMSSVRQLIDDLHQMRADIRQAAIDGGANKQKLRDAGNYVPRYISDTARKNIEKLVNSDTTGRYTEKLRKLGLLNDKNEVVAGDVSSALERASQQRGSLLERGILPEVQDLVRLNSEIAEKLRKNGIPPELIGDFFESDVLQAFALRARSAYEAVLITDIYKGLADAGADRYGRKLVYMGDGPDVGRRMAGDGANSAKYHGETLPDGTDVWIAKPVWDEINNTRRVLASHTDMNEVLRHLNAWNGLWSSYATVPLVGLGFHARNASGNVLNSFLAGIRNPARYKQAFEIQRSMARIHKVMDETGLDFAQAAKRAGVSDEHLKLINSARAHGIIGTGQVSDVFAEAKSGLGKRGDTFNPFSQRNFVVRQGRQVGEAVEHNARLALYIDGLAKGMDPKAASARVRKFLFDYSDLTRFESDVMRSISRFYTFFRKNTAVQAQMLVMYPGAIVNAERIADEWVNLMTGLTGSEEDNNFLGILPQWARSGGERVFDVAGTSTLVGLDTTFRSAGETVEQMIAGVTTLPWLGDQLNELVDYGSREQRFGKFLSFFSGGPVEAVDTFYGERFGRDPFSGRTLDNDTKSQLLRFANVLFPIAGKIDRTVAAGWNPLELRFLNMILGFSQYRMDDPQQDRALRALKFEGVQVMQDLNRAGAEVPSMKDLIDAGKIDLQSQALSLLVRYGNTDDPELQQKFTEGMEEILGSRVIDAAGMVRSSLSTSEEMTREEIAIRMDDMEVALAELRQRQGLPPLTEDELARVLLATSYAPDSRDLQDHLGIEPLSSRNRFLPKAQQEQMAAQTQETLEFLANRWGLTSQDVQRLRPLMTDAERVVQEAADAGLSYDDAVQHLIENLSRKEQGIIFGTESLPRFRDGSITDKELNAAQRRSWQRASEFSIIFHGVTGRMPREQDVWKYVYWNELNQGQLESLGMPKAPRIPRQQDVRSDRDKLRDAMLERDAVVRGVTEGPRLGDR